MGDTREQDDAEGGDGGNSLESVKELHDWMVMMRGI